MHKIMRVGRHAHRVPLNNWSGALAQVEQHVRSYYDEGERYATRVIDPDHPNDPAARHAESRELFGIGQGLILCTKIFEMYIIEGRPYFGPFLDRLVVGRRPAA